MDRDVSDNPKPPHQTTPLSCGEAWIKFAVDENVYGGSKRGNWLDDMQAAFDAGWQAAVAALRENRHD